MKTIRKTVIKTKAGYRAAGYSRGGLFIRLAIDTVCRRRLIGQPATVTLTAGTNDHSTGAHPLPRCEAVDVRVKGGVFRGAQAKRLFLLAVLVELGPLVNARQGSKGYEVFTEHYYGILEDEFGVDEHFHLQVRRGHTIGL